MGACLPQVVSAATIARFSAFFPARPDVRMFASSSSESMWAYQMSSKPIVANPAIACRYAVVASSVAAHALALLKPSVRAQIVKLAASRSRRTRMGRQGLIEVVDVEQQLPLRRSERAELRKVRVTAQLHVQPGRRRARQIHGHDLRRTRKKVNGDAIIRPCRIGTRSGSRAASCACSNATGSGRSAAGTKPSWAAGGVRVRASLPCARRLVASGCATFRPAILSPPTVNLAVSGVSRGLTNQGSAWPSRCRISSTRARPDAHEEGRGVV